MIDADKIDMRGALNYWRRKPIFAKKLIANVELRARGQLQLGEPGDWLCQTAEGEKFIVTAEAFKFLFSPKPPPEE